MADNSIVIDTSNFEQGLQGLENGVKTQLENAFLVPIAQEVLPCLNELANSIVAAFSSDEISSRVQVVAEKLGELAKSITSVVEDWLPKLTEGLTWVLGNSDAIVAGIVGIGTALKVFEAAQLVMGLVKAYETAAEATKGLTVAQWLLNVAIDSNPIGAIVALIVGAIAAIIYFCTTNDSAREAIIGAWNAICECATAVWGSICTFFTETVPEFFTTLWETICQLCSDGWALVVEFFTETIPQTLEALFAFIAETLPEYFASLWENICQFCSDGWNLIVAFFTESIPAFFEMLAEWFNTLPEAAGVLLATILATIVNFGLQIIEWATTNVPLIIETIVTFFTTLPETIGTWLLAVIDKFIEWGINVITWITTNVPLWITSIVTFFSGLPEAIGTWLLSVITKFAEWGTNIVTWISTNVPLWISSIVTFFSGLPEQIWTWLVNTVTKIGEWGSNMLTKANEGMTNMCTSIIETMQGLPEQMATIGANIVTGIWNGISGSIDWIKSKISDFCGGIVAGFEDALDIHSPSRIMRDLIGTNIIKGIGVGIELESPNLEKDINSNMSNLTSKLKTTVDYETARTTASISANANKESGVNNPTTTNNNDNGINVNIEKFNGTDRQNIEELAQEIAFLSKRKLV